MQEMDAMHFDLEDLAAVRDCLSEERNRLAEEKARLESDIERS